MNFRSPELQLRRAIEIRVAEPAPLPKPLPKAVTAKFGYCAAKVVTISTDSYGGITEAEIHWRTINSDADREPFINAQGQQDYHYKYDCGTDWGAVFPKYRLVENPTFGYSYQCRARVEYVNGEYIVHRKWFQNPAWNFEDSPAERGRKYLESVKEMRPWYLNRCDEGYITAQIRRTVSHGKSPTAPIVMPPVTFLPMPPMPTPPPIPPFKAPPLPSYVEIFRRWIARIRRGRIRLKTTVTHSAPSASAPLRNNQHTIEVQFAPSGAAQYDFEIYLNGTLVFSNINVPFTTLQGVSFGGMAFSQPMTSSTTAAESLWSDSGNKVRVRMFNGVPTVPDFIIVQVYGGVKLPSGTLSKQLLNQQVFNPSLLDLEIDYTSPAFDK